MTARIAALSRHPVKGFSPEPLEAAALEAGRGFPGDRLFAVENGPSGFDPAAPEHQPKIKYLQTMRDPELWRFGARFDPVSGVLSLSRDGAPLAAGEAGTPAGRRVLEAALETALQGRTRGPLRLLAAPGWQFMDSRSGFVSLIGSASIADLGVRTERALDARRFRANVIVDGLAPWAEFDLVGRRIRLGGAVLKVTKRIDRCRAIDADPERFRHDGDLVGALERGYGHHDCGVYASIESGGRIALGDTLSVLPDLDGEPPLGRDQLGFG